MNQLHSHITRLHNEGKTNSEIKTLLGCSTTSILYHLDPKYRESVKRRSKARSKEYYRKYYKSTDGRIHASRKFTQFQRAYAKKHKLQNTTKKSTTKELMNKIGDSPRCYLTGAVINLTAPATYSFDHIIPMAKKGKDILENLGLATREANLAKNDKTPEEFFALCKRVLEHNGYTVQKNNV